MSAKENKLRRQRERRERGECVECGEDAAVKKNGKPFSRCRKHQRAAAANMASLRKRAETT